MEACFTKPALRRYPKRRFAYSWKRDIPIVTRRNLMARTMRTRLLLMCLMTLIIITISPLNQTAQSSEVRVTNFPDTQKIKGAVTVDGSAKSLKRESILLPPSRRTELNELFHAGKIETEGYTHVSIYLQGEIKSSTFLSGNIGLFLIPDEEPIFKTFKETKQIQFPIEIACTISSGDSEFFNCSSNNQLIGFARYRIESPPVI